MISGSYCRVGILLRSQHRSGNSSVRVGQRSRLILREASMLEPQTSTLSPRVAARPRCPKCQSRMEVQHITSARSGFEHWTLRCTECRLIHDAQVNADPMKSDAIGW